MAFDNNTSRGQILLLPFIAISLSVVALTLAVFYLLNTASALKKDNEAAMYAMATIKSSYDTALAALDTKDQENAKTASASQADIQDLKNQLAALQGQMKTLQADTTDPVFTVDSFSLKFFNDTAYKYQSYEGTGIIRTEDTKDSFFVLLKKTLKSGGAAATQKVEYVPILIVGGNGTFVTSDTAEGALQKPDYEFAIVGFDRIKMNDTPN